MSVKVKPDVVPARIRWQGDLRPQDPSPAADRLRHVTVTAPPLFGAAVRARRLEREPPEPPRVDRGPFCWPLLLAALLLAALAVVVAPAGAVVL